MEIKKIEIKGSDGSIDDHFLYEETKLGHLFIVTNSFGNTIDDVKAEEFIAKEIFDNIKKSTELDNFQLVQSAIIQTNEKLLAINTKSDNRIIGSALVVLIGVSETWCFYVGSTYVNVSVKSKKQPYKKYFGSEGLVDANGALSTCLGFKKIVPLVKTTQTETGKPNKNGVARTINRTVYVPNEEFEYDERNDYLLAYKKLNIKSKSKSKSKKFRFLMCTSDFNKALRDDLKENLLNSDEDLSEVELNYQQQIDLYIRKNEDYNREYRSLLGVFVECEG